MRYLSQEGLKDGGGKVRRTCTRTPHAYQTRVRERHLPPAHVGLRRIWANRAGLNVFLSHSIHGSSRSPLDRLTRGSTHSISATFPSSTSWFALVLYHLLLNTTDRCQVLCPTRPLTKNVFLVGRWIIHCETGHQLLDVHSHWTFQRNSHPIWESAEIVKFPSRASRYKNSQKILVNSQPIPFREGIDWPIEWYLLICWSLWISNSGFLDISYVFKYLLMSHL